MIHIEVRKKIVEARKKGLKIKEICHAYGVGKTAVFRLLKQERETGDITPKTHLRGRKPALDETQLQQLRELLDSRPDITLEEIREEMGLDISISALSRIIRNKLHYNYKKKTVHASERDRPDVVAKRESWKENQEELDINRLVFLDESGVNTNMTRRYGRSFQGTRVHDSAPLNKPKSTTILSSIRADGSTVPMVFSGALNRERFKEYLKEYLLPTLKPGDIVIADNLRAHKGDGVEELVASVGAVILYLPPYSPDLNPIEKLWSKIKAFLRMIKARTVDALLEAIPLAFSSISEQDAIGWFSSSGYSL